MEKELKELRAELSAEFAKPKAKNVGKNGATHYRGVPIDKVSVRDSTRIDALHSGINAAKPVSFRRKPLQKTRNHAKSAKMKGKSYNRRGKILDYLPSWLSRTYQKNAKKNE